MLTSFPASRGSCLLLGEPWRCGWQLHVIVQVDQGSRESVSIHGAVWGLSWSPHSGPFLVLTARTLQSMEAQGLESSTNLSSAVTC